MSPNCSDKARLKGTYSQTEMRSVWQVIISVSAEGTLQGLGGPAVSLDPGQKSQLGISFLCSRAGGKTESGCNLISAMEAAQKNKSFQCCQSVLKREGFVPRECG